MKLKPHWSIEEDHSKEKDTSLIGKIVYCHCQEPMSSLSYALSTAHIIGWRVELKEKDKGYFTFTSLSDGMTICYSLEALIEALNRQPYIPIPSSVLHAIMMEKQPLK